MNDLAAYQLIVELFGEVFVVRWDDIYFVEYVPPEEETCDE